MNDQPKYRVRACAVVLKGEDLLMVNILDDVLGRHYWMPPGGEIEEGEEGWQTAERETKEEAGVLIRTYPETEVVTEYYFEFQGQQHLSKTYFFLAEYIDEDEKFNPNLREKEIYTSEWVPLKMGLERLRSWPDIQNAVFELVQPLSRGRNGSRNVNIAIPFKESIEED